MTIAESMLAEFTHEFASTSKILARVPFEQAGWTPHPKSRPLGPLAVHIANIPSWVPSIVGETELHLNPPGGPVFQPPEVSSTDELVALFDRVSTRALAALADVPNSVMGELWTLKNGGREVFKIPRAAALRAFTMSHLIHHRGQLTVYLRLNDIPLPGIYGPTADEAF